jgi:hypothetical protein
MALPLNALFLGGLHLEVCVRAGRGVSAGVGVPILSQGKNTVRADTCSANNDKITFTRRCE